MRLVQYAMVPHRGLFFSVCPLLVITVRINDMEASYAPACFIEFLRKQKEWALLTRRHFCR